MLEKQIKEFNAMYKLPVSKYPSLHNLGVDPVQRLKDFKSVLTEELDEIDEIMQMLVTNGDSDLVEGKPFGEITILTALADLLGDIQVYCASEMAKFGLPQELILNIIMQSNFSKLGEDGKPIYDERGKVQKGPNYWKPEPKIASLLMQCYLRDEDVLQLPEKAKIPETSPFKGAFDSLYDKFTKGVA